MTYGKPADRLTDDFDAPTDLEALDPRSSKIAPWEVSVVELRISRRRLDEGDLSFLRAVGDELDRRVMRTNTLRELLERAVSEARSTIARFDFDGEALTLAAELGIKSRMRPAELAALSAFIRSQARAELERLEELRDAVEQGAPITLGDLVRRPLADCTRAIEASLRVQRRRSSRLAG
jgi:hypothetical protein